MIVKIYWSFTIIYAKPYGKGLNPMLSTIPLIISTTLYYFRGVILPTPHMQKLRLKEMFTNWHQSKIKDQSFKLANGEKLWQDKPFLPCKMLL